MKAIDIITFCTVPLLFFSCSKGEFYPQDGAVSISIESDMAEYSNDTKSSAVQVVRLTWAAGDLVYAYGKTSAGTIQLLSPGALKTDKAGTTTTVSGTLSQIPSDGVLYFVHSPKFQTAPAITGGKISIDMSTQGTADRANYVIYAVVKNVSSTNISKLSAQYYFATSTFRFNGTNLPESSKLSTATISNVQTVCDLTFSNGAASVASSSYGTVTKDISNLSTNDRGTRAVYFDLPQITTSSATTLTIHTSNGLFYNAQPCLTKDQTYKYGTYNHASCSMSIGVIDYIDSWGINRGPGVKVGSIWWAPVNCGYYTDTLKYGKLFQFGRLAGTSFDSEKDCNQATYQKAAYRTVELLTSPDSDYFYRNDDEANPLGDWYTTVQSKQFNGWPAEAPAGTSGIGNPCPKGWRVPTADDFLELDFTNGGSVWTSGTKDSLHRAGRIMYARGCGKDRAGSSVFFPAAGRRQHLDADIIKRGEFIERDTVGYYWSASNAAPAGTDDINKLQCSYGAIDMWVKKEGAGLNMGYFRAEGFSVRCVHD